MTCRVEVVDETGTVTAQTALAELVAAVLREEKREGAVVLALVDESTISGLNRRYRGEAGPTDVLSFPEACDGRGEGSWPLDGGFEDDPAAACASLGEIVISPAIVRRYALEEGQSFGRQLGWTIIHGTLHLLGHDHELDQGEMRAREQVLLQRLPSDLQL